MKKVNLKIILYRFIVFDTGLNTHHAYKKNEFKKNNNHEIQSIEL